MPSVQANIAGNYALFKEGDLNGKCVGHMNIGHLQNGQFVIGIAAPSGNPATDWQGKGILQGNSGYYTWVFKNGKKGRTTFSIDKSGNIHGKVRGSGVNWDYVARRQ